MVTYQTIMDFFNNNPVLNLITLILAVLGILFTAYFYLRSKKNRVPTYMVRTINLVRDMLPKIDAVEMLYSGKKVNNLSISKVAFWNEGKETINFIDIAPQKPIKIIINDEYDILDVGILFQKNDANNFKINISEDKKSVDITFDYFDYNEGMVLQIFHTGNCSENIKIEGKIKSVKKINRKDFGLSFITNLFSIFPKSFAYSKITKIILGWIILIIGLSFCFLSIYYSIRLQNWHFVDFSNIFFLGVGLSYAFFGYQSLKKKIPKGYDIFSDEF